MAKKMLEKMSRKLGRRQNDESKIVDEELSAVLDEHLDRIAAAHKSVHNDHHSSSP